MIIYVRFGVSLAEGAESFERGEEEGNFIGREVVDE